MLRGELFRGIRRVDARRVSAVAHLRPGRRQERRYHQLLAHRQVLRPLHGRGFERIRGRRFAPARGPARPVPIRSVFQTVGDRLGKFGLLAALARVAAIPLAPVAAARLGRRRRRGRRHIPRHAVVILVDVQPHRHDATIDAGRRTRMLRHLARCAGGRRCGDDGGRQSDAEGGDEFPHVSYLASTLFFCPPRHLRPPPDASKTPSWRESRNVPRGGEGIANPSSAARVNRQKKDAAPPVRNSVSLRQRGV